MRAEVRCISAVVRVRVSLASYICNARQSSFVSRKTGLSIAESSRA